VTPRRTEYEIRDAESHLHAIHVRVDGPDGHKRFEWLKPDRKGGLAGRRAASLPLYGSERASTWEPDAPVVVVEGERACDALLTHGLNAVATVTGAASCPEPAVLEVLRNRRVTLWPDADEQGLKHMARLAERLRGVASSVTVFEWPDAPAKGDAADYLSTPDAASRLVHALAQASPWTALPHTDSAPPPRRRVQGAAFVLSDAEPWPDPVEGGPLLDQVADALTRYAVMPAPGTTATTLWIAMTYLTDAVNVLPRLLLTSPTRECGKSRVLALLGALVRRPLASSSISPSALFRTIDAAQPTLLLDEVDNSRLRDNPEFRAVLNSGHTRAQAFTIRNVGEHHEPRQFSTWAAIAMAAIGQLPDTVASRSIRVPMRRKRRDEAIAQFREGQVFAELELLRRKLARWCGDRAETIRNADTKVPEPLDGREADNWTPLIAIADAAGGHWPERARSAAREMGGAVQDDEDARVTLLGDLLDLFDRHGERMASDDLVGNLRAMETRPWPEWREGKPITARGVAKLLKPFGIEPRDLRLADGRRLKGYERTWFEDVWPRYLPAHPRPPRQSAPVADTSGARDARRVELVADTGGASGPHEDGPVTDVADVPGAEGPALTPIHQRELDPANGPLAEFMRTELGRALGDS
jgi:hypothetical protein